MARVRIESKDDLEKWLNVLPGEQRRQVAVAIACRAALRVVPVVETWLRGDEGRAIDIVLPIFRAMAASWAVAVGPAGDAELRNAAHAAAAFAAPALRATDTTDAADAAYSAADAAYSAAYAAAYAAAVYAAYAAYAAARAAAADAWEAVKADVNAIVNGESVPEMVNTPLWPNGTPAWVQELWDSMKRRLLAREDEHWEVWTNWYDVRLDPSKAIPCYSPPIEELERKRVLLPDELWQQGPAAVNAEIKRLIEEHPCSGGSAKTSKITAYAVVSPEKQVSEKQAAENPEAADTHLVPDAPTDEVDYLARADLALVVAGKLNEIWDEQKELKVTDGRPVPGFVAHIDAPWGGGKTSFAAMVAKILNPWKEADAPEWLKALHLEDTRVWPERFRRPWQVVWFNAWQHEHLRPPWWNFYESIRRQLIHGLRPPANDELSSAGRIFHDPLPYWWQRVKLYFDELKWRLLRADIVWPAIGLVALAVVLWLTLGFNNIRSLIAIVTGLLGGGVVLWRFFSSLRRVVQPGAAENDRLIGADDPMNRMRAHFAEVMERVEYPVLVVVDDLDRCKPDYVVELLRGMQTILASPRVIYLLLGDRDWIEKAFAVSHKDMEGIDVGPEHEFGGRFVEKAIQFSLSLPLLSEKTRREYVRRLLGIREPAEWVPEIPEETKRKVAEVLREEDILQREHKATELLRDEALKALPEQARADLRRELATNLVRRGVAEAAEKKEAAIRHMLEGLAPLLPDNPRQIKRVINALSVLQEVVRLDDPLRGPGTVDWCKLARWVVLMIEWPRSWVTLSRHPELADRLDENSSELLGHPVEPVVIKLMLGKGLEPPWNTKITTRDIQEWLSPNVPAASGVPWPEPEKKE